MGTVTIFSGRHDEDRLWHSRPRMCTLSPGAMQIQIEYDQRQTITMNEPEE